MLICVQGCLIGNLNTTLFEEQKMELFKDTSFEGKSIDIASPTDLMSLSHFSLLVLVNHYY